MTQRKTVTVIGAGIMGPGIAQVFAASGFEACLCDLSDTALDTARGTLANNLELMLELGLIDDAAAADISRRIRVTTDIAGSLQGADIVVEAVTESTKVKSEVLDLVARAASADADVWSNTSSLDVFSLAPERLHDRLLITHWFAPPHILPLVEVVKGPGTNPARLRSAVDILTRMERTPVVMERYVPGFAINRLLRALGREAFYLIDGGYITAENLDLAVRASLAARMMILGVVQRYDFTGLDLSARNLANADFVDAPIDLHPRSLLEHVERGELGVKTGRGFYDYEGLSFHEASRKRDRVLWKLMMSCGELATAKRVV